MKNVFLLQTDKPTGIFESKISGLQYSIMPKIRTNPLVGFHLYITSDKEIKEGDWLIVNDEDVMQMKSSYDNDMSGEDIWVGDSLNGYATYKDNCKKIILTTDPQLIQDGVQAIDDEFLGWFLKNPSCEEVEYVGDDCYYEIIIPQEEPKQYPIGGYAPGFYSCKCVTCKTEFTGDKRAVQCEPCAIKMTQKELVMLTQEQIEIEIIKCKKSPYYFATKYLTVKNHKGEYIKFQTPLTEKEFNNKFKQ